MSEIKHQHNVAHSPVTIPEIRDIIHSHDRLKRWNDLNEQALLRQPDPQLISNIRATAAQIMLEKRSVSSENFELMRAMNLFDRTISIQEAAQAASDSAGITLVEKIKAVLATPETESMNLAHARERSQAAADMPAKLALSTYHVAYKLAQNPQAAYNAIAREFSSGITLTQDALAKNMVSENPSRAVGTMIGASISDLAINTLNPGRKMTWYSYANLLGEGTVLPPAKPFRDFSDKMTFSKAKWREPEVDYQASEHHGINLGINDRLGLYFGIKAEDNRSQYGSGSEMFLSAIKVFHQNNLAITNMTSFWEHGSMGSNHQQFLHAYKSGASLKQAASQTFTGKMAARLGLTAVDTSQLQAAVAKKDLSQLSPSFLHPDWGADDQMNNYSHAYSLAHG